MKISRIVNLGMMVLPFLWLETSVRGAEPAPHIQSVAKPQAGDMQIIFHGGAGPFRIQTRASMEASAPWYDVPKASVAEVQPGVFLGLIPGGTYDVGFYRIVSETETVLELKGWTVLLQVSAPTNLLYFVAGERPVVSVTILDNLAQGLNKSSFSTLALYMQGPQDPLQMVTAAKLLNASTDRAARPHHYIDLKANPDVQVNGNTLTYTLQPVTSEAPGTYTVSLRAIHGTDAIQQIMKFVDVQIGTAVVEQPVVTKDKCAACHEGTISGKTYLHHIDPSTPGAAGSWSLDYTPVRSCQACHNNDGYASFRDSNAPGGRVADHIVLRVHGVHMGEHLKNAFNTDPETGNFKDYTHLLFPADVRNCTTCHVDDRWKTKPSRLACGACHDNVWFGAVAAKPEGMELHGGGPKTVDSNCSFCHPADGPVEEGGSYPVSTVHQVPPPNMDEVSINLTPPVNGQYYVAGEKPVVTLVIKDDAGNPIDHTKVTDGNFSTASVFVYGPRSRSVPVLTSAARNLNSKLRASVSSSVAGPWAINGKVFKLAINGSAPQEIPMVGAGELVTAAEVVAALNPVITNLNGGAKATVSGANVNIKTLIQGATARIEIYNGDVTTAMGWKRKPNTVMEPDVTVAAASTHPNDLRVLSDPLDYADPMVTRNAGDITYQLDDVAGLAPGTYCIYVYHLPKAGKIAGLTAPTGLGFLTFQVGTATPEKKIAGNCTSCHGDTIMHLHAGPIHAAPFDADWCKACHDYGHPSTGDMFKNQGGTSLGGWSGFGAMPISRRVHGVHFAHYLEHSEEIYANATKETFGGIIFPQDVRNCTKCHAETDTWKQKPSRVACLACHDTDAAKVHGQLMTLITDPNDPYGPGAKESCDICHGANKEFSPDKVHSIAKPYVPPYPREAAE